MRLVIYIFKRLIQLIPILIGISLITFAIARLLPGNPAVLAAGPLGTEEQIEEIKHEMGLDRPIWEQYGLYMRDLLRGDFGTSWRTGLPVTTELLNRFPATFELITLAMLVAILIGIPLGALAAVRQGTGFDHFVRVFSVGGVSIPVFWSGLMLMFVFYYLLHWAPAPIGRIGFGIRPPTHITGMYVIDSILTGNGTALLSSLKQLALPLVTLVFAMISPIVRITRTTMLDVSREDYVRTAKASGLHRRTVIFRDTLRNALLPVITTIGLQYGYSLGGEVLVEQIFSWPGMGRYSIDAIFNLDYAPVQAFVMFVALIYITINLIVDVLYALLDPRIRY
jgi:peptide/nickel transport system permease protein